MTFRSGRSLKRYILILSILAIVIYFSSLQVRNLDTTITDDEDYTISYNNKINYIPPPQRHNNHDINDIHLEISQSHTFLTELAMKRIDRKYCGQDRCRFLLPVAITEQGNKKV